MGTSNRVRFSHATQWPIPRHPVGVETARRQSESGSLRDVDLASDHDRQTRRVVGRLPCIGPLGATRHWTKVAQLTERFKSSPLPPPDFRGLPRLERTTHCSISRTEPPTRSSATMSRSSSRFRPSVISRADDGSVPRPRDSSSGAPAMSSTWRVTPIRTVPSYSRGMGLSRPAWASSRFPTVNIVSSSPYSNHSGQPESGALRNLDLADNHDCERRRNVVEYRDAPDCHRGRSVVSNNSIDGADSHA